jgi:hypothetical protein
MPTQVAQLHLPAPSEEFLDQFRACVRALPLNSDHKHWLDQFHSNQINSALHLFTPVPELDSVLRQEYQQYFHGHQIDCWAGVMSNTGPGPACLPPHSDRGRALAINYYVDLGGDHVTTVFYDRVEPTLDQSTNVLYDQVQAVEQQVFGCDWYAYNVNRCHSVEHIESQRAVLIIRLATQDPAYDLDNLKQHYPGLFD